MVKVSSFLISTSEANLNCGIGPYKEFIQRLFNKSSQSSLSFSLYIHDRGA
jgi:hypothetical protein